MPRVIVTKGTIIMPLYMTRRSIPSIRVLRLDIKLNARRYGPEVHGRRKMPVIVPMKKAVRKLSEVFLKSLETLFDKGSGICLNLLFNMPSIVPRSPKEIPKKKMKFRTARSPTENPRIVSYREVVDLLKDLDSAGCLTNSSIAIISEPEPETEEALEYGVIANWLSQMGVQFYRIRASGHYYTYQLKKILSFIKPKKKIEVIHTVKPDLFNRLIKSITYIS